MLGPGVPPTERRSNVRCVVPVPVPRALPQSVRDGAAPLAACRAHAWSSPPRSGSLTMKAVGASAFWGTWAVGAGAASGAGVTASAVAGEIDHLQARRVRFDARDHIVVCAQPRAFGRRRRRRRSNKKRRRRSSRSRRAAATPSRAPCSSTWVNCARRMTKRKRRETAIKRRCRGKLLKQENCILPNNLSRSGINVK